MNAFVVYCTRLLLYTEKDGVAAKKVLRDFELSVVRSKDATDEKLWEAKRSIRLKGYWI